MIFSSDRLIVKESKKLKICITEEEFISILYGRVSNSGSEEFSWCLVILLYLISEIAIYK